MVMSAREIILIATVCVLIAFVAGVVIGANHVGTTILANGETEIAAPSHLHEMREVVAPYPTLSVDIIPDSRMGWNLHLQTTNFTFAPERVNQAYQAGEGHAHLYINGERITRLYGPWYYLADVPSGEHVVTVSLSGNDHSELVAGGEPIQVSQTLVVE